MTRTLPQGLHTKCLWDGLAIVSVGIRSMTIAAPLAVVSVGIAIVSLGIRSQSCRDRSGTVRQRFDRNVFLESARSGLARTPT